MTDETADEMLEVILHSQFEMADEMPDGKADNLFYLQGEIANEQFDLQEEMANEIFYSQNETFYSYCTNYFISETELFVFPFWSYFSL